MILVTTGGSAVDEDSGAGAFEFDGWSGVVVVLAGVLGLLPEDTGATLDDVDDGAGTFSVSAPERVVGGTLGSRLGSSNSGGRVCAIEKNCGQITCLTGYLQERTLGVA